jgi:hypothetical protein
MQFDRIDQRTDSAVNDCSHRTRTGISQMQVSRILRAGLTTLNALVEHAQTGDRTAGEQVVLGPSRTRPPTLGRRCRGWSTHTTRRCVRRSRQQPVMG